MFLPSTITLSPGDSGDFVRELQRRLSSLNLYPAEALSGFYDGTTTSAVTSFQFQQGLRSDGIAGPETLRRLNGVLSGTADSTPAQTQPTEDVMKAFYMVDHLVNEDSVAAAQQQPDAFSFQQQPVAEQHIHTAAPVTQAFVPPAPTQQPPAIPAAIIPEPVPVQSFVPPPPTQHHHEVVIPPAAKPIDPMLQPVQQPVQEKPPVQPELKPQPAPQAPQPVKPIDAMLQPAPQPVQEKPAAPTMPEPRMEQQPQKPLEQKPIEQVFAPQPKPQPAPAIPEPRMEQPQKPLEQKPATPPTQENEQTSPERQSLRQRFTGMMQRVADYMESKLPQSVQAEVQKIGLQMAERGVREIPIPPNETALPSPSATPGRGPAQTAER